MDTEDKNEKKAPLNKHERAMAGAEKAKNIRLLRNLNGEGRWTPLQEVMQDIYASYLVNNPDNLPPYTKMVEDLKKETKVRFEVENPDLYDLLKKSMPSHNGIREWFKTKDWDETVWKKIRESGLFSKERRAAMINALYKRGIEKDTVAAKLYLTMSGDYVEKSENVNKDATIDKFREINQILHKKTKTETEQ